jgi:hypothetical protein
VDRLKLYSQEDFTGMEYKSTLLAWSLFKSFIVEDRAISREEKAEKALEAKMAESISHTVAS